MSDDRPLPEHGEPHVGEWAERCPRCGTAADAAVRRCVMCRLPNPTPAGYMLRSHDDPEALL